MRERPEVSVLMPTYNDSKYIPTAIQSVLNQSYRNWELIIIDGSTDDTPAIVKKFDDSRIVYLREKRSGQLNALMDSIPFIQGKYITLLHSDDELLDERMFERNTFALRNYECDGVFSDLLLMNENREIYGRVKTVNNVGISSPAILFLRGGSNIIPDFFFVRKEAFNQVLLNYITWNLPYWLKFEKTHISTLTLKKVEPWYKYRVYPENYIRSNVGKFENVNGCLRTVIEIGQRIDLPFLKVQRLAVRVFKRRLKPLFKPNPCSPEHLREMVVYVIQRSYKVLENPYLKALLAFYSNFPSNRIIELQFKDEDEIFLGKDARIFFNLIEKNKLPAVYEYVLQEATNGFGKVVVNSEEDYKKAKNMMKFLNLLTKIAISTNWKA